MRGYNPVRRVHWATVGDLPLGFRLERPSFLILSARHSAADSDNSSSDLILIYECTKNEFRSNYLSKHSNCEGDRGHMIRKAGYLFKSKNSNNSLSALYLCHVKYNDDYFVSTQVKCEQTYARNVYILGYFLIN